MNRSKPIRFALIASIALVMMTAHEKLVAQTVTYAYPLSGQTAEQQAKDDCECKAWAKSQTGFDPSAPPPQAQASYTAPPPSPQGGLLRGALGGAALGAVGGAIAGDAGTGAAIGAATGALFGTMRRASSDSQQQQWQAQQQAQLAQQQQALDQQYQQGLSNFNRAYTACMGGREYQVQ
jgi:hypothetical protein